MFTFRKTALDESDKFQKWYEVSSVRRWVPIEDWTGYFEAVSDLKHYYLYSVYDKDQLIAAISAEIIDNTAAICLVVDPALHGLGFGTLILQDMQYKTRKLFGNIHGYVAGIFPGNIASIKCFEKAGFIKTKKGNDGEDIYSCVVMEI